MDCVVIEMINLAYNDNLKKYYNNGEEISEAEYNNLKARLQFACELVERIESGETVEIPDDIADIVEGQLEVIAERKREAENLDDAEALNIILGGAE